MVALEWGDMVASAFSLASPPSMMRISGRSDQGSCRPSRSSSPWTSQPLKSSSPRTPLPAPASISRHSSPPPAQAAHVRPAPPSTWQAIAASRPVGARTRIRSSLRSRSWSAMRGSGPVLEQRLPAAQVGQVSPQHALEVGQRLADARPARPQAELADAALMGAGAFLEHGDGLPDLAEGLEIAQQDDVVRQVAELHRRFDDAAHETVLGHDQQRQHAALVEKRQQLAQGQRQEAGLEEDR